MNEEEILSEEEFSARLQQVYEAFELNLAPQNMTESDLSKLCYIMALKQFNCKVRFYNFYRNTYEVVKI